MHRVFKGESIYLAELDIHFPELTLGQSLAFAASTRETGQSRGPKSQKLGYNMAVLFGLENAINTWMGNTMIRGASGGEKRRTSIAEALVGGAQFQCWDNSTRGLDSSTALKFVELLKENAAKLQTTVAMSIYQASESIYNVSEGFSQFIGRTFLRLTHLFKSFDKVTLLYEGRQIYFGDSHSAVQYFHDLGFERPARGTTPDFLTSLTNPAERIVREGYQDRVPYSPDDFARAWKQSVQSRHLVSDIEKFNNDHPIVVDTHATHRDTSKWREKLRYVTKKLVMLMLIPNLIFSLRSATYSIPMFLQVHICLQRCAQRLRNLPGPVIGGIFANAILALVVGSVYYDLSMTSDSMDRRAILIFFSLLVTAFSPAFEVRPFPSAFSLTGGLN